MNGTLAAASASIWATVLPPLMLVRSASVTCVGILRLRLRIISTNAARSRTCSRGLPAISSARVEWLRPLYSCAGCTLSAGSRRSTRLKRLSYSAPGSPLGRSVRPVAPIRSVSPVNSRSSTVRHIESRVCPGVCSTLSRRASHRQHLTVIEREIDERRGARAVHDDGDIEPRGELLRRGEVIGVRVGVDQVVDAQSAARRRRQVTVDQADLRIDERAGAALGATDQVRLAAPGAELLEDHRSSLWSPAIMRGSARLPTISTTTPSTTMAAASHSRPVTVSPATPVPSRSAMTGLTKV